MGSCANFRTVLSESWRRQPKNPLVAEPETDFNAKGHSGSFKVIYIGIIEEPLMGYIAQYKNVALDVKVRKI